MVFMNTSRQEQRRRKIKFRMQKGILMHENPKKRYRIRLRKKHVLDFFSKMLLIYLAVLIRKNSSGNQWP